MDKYRHRSFWLCYTMISLKGKYFYAIYSREFEFTRPWHMLIHMESFDAISKQRNDEDSLF